MSTVPELSDEDRARLLADHPEWGLVRDGKVTLVAQHAGAL